MKMFEDGEWDDYLLEAGFKDQRGGLWNPRELAQKRLGPNHEFGKFGPLRALSKFSHLPHGRRADDSHIFVAITIAAMPSTLLLSAISATISNYSPKAFVSASEIAFLMH